MMKKFANRACKNCKSTNGYVLASGVFVCRACGARTAKLNEGEAQPEPTAKQDDQSDLSEFDK